MSSEIIAFEYNYLFIFISTTWIIMILVLSYFIILVDSSQTTNHLEGLIIFLYYTKDLSRFFEIDPSFSSLQNWLWNDLSWFGWDIPRSLDNVLPSNRIFTVSSFWGTSLFTTANPSIPFRDDNWFKNEDFKERYVLSGRLVLFAHSNWTTRDQTGYHLNKCAYVHHQ